MSDPIIRECDFIPMTPSLPGAIGIIQLHGKVLPVLRAMTGRDDWPIGRARLVPFRDIDEGLAVRLDEDVAQIMPHGGPRVMQRMATCLRELGATDNREDELPPTSMFPEAADEVEAIALAAIARAASPLAIDLLLAQPAIWRDVREHRAHVTEQDRARSHRLNRLISPPLVVLAGPPNVGKSTLSNALVGRSMSIAVDMPGTTRDYTTARIELAGLVVNWHDTPGLRETDDPIEARAIALAQRLMESADLLIAMTDAEQDWPRLAREADLKVANKADIAQRDDADVAISAHAAEGIAALVRAVRDRLVPPDDLAATEKRPWVFDERLAQPVDVTAP